MAKKLPFQESSYYGSQIDPMTGLQPSSDIDADQLYDPMLGVWNAPISRVETEEELGSRYDTSVQPFVDLGKIRGERQSAISQLGSAINQAVLGAVIGGTVEEVGYLLDLPQYINLADGTEKEFGNWLSDIGKSLRTWTSEATPIYTTYEEGKFAPGHWSWWMSNAPSVASTLSLLIPSGLAVRGATAIAKAAGIGKELGIASRWVAKGLTRAVVSRHMENMMEASQTFSDTFNQALSSGMSDDEARRKASIAASSTYNTDWAMLIQDIPQYLLLNRAFNVASLENTMDVVRKMGKSIAPVVGKKAAAIGWDMLTEGGEEAFQYIAQKEGQYLADVAYDPSLQRSFGDRIDSYLADGDLWTQGFFGAIGAGVTQTVGRAVNKALTGHKDPRIEDIQSWGSQFSYWNQRMKEAQEDGDTNSERFAKDALWSTLGTKAATVGNSRNAMDFLEAMKNPTPEELETFGVNEDDLKVFQTEIPKGIEKIKRIEKLYNDNFKQYGNQDKAQLVTYHQSLLEDQIANKNRLQTLVNQDRSMIPNLDILPPHVRDYIFHDTDSKLIQKRIEFFQKALDRAANKTEKDHYQNNINDLNRQLKDKEDAKNDIKLTGEYTKSFIDKFMSKVESKPLEDYRRHLQELEYSKHAISDLQSDLERVKRDDYISEPEDRSAHERKIREDEKESKVYQPSIDDVVVYTNPTTGEESLHKISDIDDTTGNTSISPVDENGNIIEGVQPLIVDINSLRLYEKEKDEEEQPETINFDETPDIDKKLYSEETGRGLRDVSSSVSHSHWDQSQKKTIVRNKAFDMHISNPVNTLKGDQVSFNIDTSTDDDYKSNFWKRNKNIKDKLDKGEVFNKADIDKIVNAYQIVRGEDRFNSIVDNLPIKISYKTETREVFDSGLYYHDTSFIRQYPSGEWNIYIPLKVIEENRINEYIAAERDKVRQNRRILLTALLSGKQVILHNIQKTVGIPNNTGINRLINEVLGEDANQIQLGIAGRNEVVWTGKDNSPNMKGTGSVGNVFIQTNKTCNGETATIKCNVSKLSPEHARILWYTLIARSHRGSGGNQGINKVADVEGLTYGQTINLLTTFGPSTNIDRPSKIDKKHLANKQLYIDRKLVLHYGTNTVNIHDIFKGDQEFVDVERDKFVNWATTSKNYSVNKEIADLGVELNKPMKRRFKLGSWVSDGNDTYSGFLIKNGVVKTDVAEFEGTGSLFHAPVTIIDISESGYTALPSTPVIQKAKGVITKTETQSEKKSTKPANTGTKTIIGEPEVKVSPDDINKLKSLPIGTEIYVNVSSVMGTGAGARKSVVPTLFMSVIDDGGKKAYQIKSPRIRAAFGISIESYEIDPEPIVEIGDNTAKTLSIILTNWKDYTIKVPETVEEVELPPTITPPEVIEESQESIDDTNFTGDPLTDINIGTEAPFKLAYTVPTKYKVIDLNKELKWFRDRFKDVPVEVINGLIYTSRTGKKAFGQLTRDGIRLSDVAEEGTLYHEAFHRVSILYLDNESRSEIYGEARRKYRNYKLTDSEVEERLAEDFRNYVIRKNEDSTHSIIGKIGQFFKNLYYLIKRVFTGSNRLTNLDIDKLFKSISTGRFRSYKPLQENLDRLGFGTYELEYRGVKLDNIFNYKVFREVIRGLSSLLTEDIRNKLFSKEERVSKYATVDVINSVKSIDFTGLKTKLQNLVTRYNDHASKNKNTIDTIEKGNLSPELASQLKDQYKVDSISTLAQKAYQGLENALRLSSLYQEVVDNYETIFKDAIEDYIGTSLGVRKVTGEDEDKRVTNKEISSYDEESYERSAKDSISNSVKFLLSFLHESTEVDPYTGLHKFVGFDEIWSRVMNDLHDQDKVEDMIKILSSKTDYLPYQQLAEKLKYGSENLRSQFFRSIRKHRHSFINVLFNEVVEKGKRRNFTIYFSDADVQNAARNAVSTWGEVFALSDLFDGDKLLTSKLSKIVKSYDLLLKDYRNAIATKSLISTTDYKNRLISLLNDIHIEVDSKTIDNLTTDIMKSGKAGTEEDALLNLLSDKMYYLFSDDGTLMKYARGEAIRSRIKLEPKTLFRNESIVAEVARAFAKTNYENISDNVPGADGNNHHVFSDNSYTTDVVRYIKNDNEYLDKLLRDVHSKYSYYLNQIKSDNTVRDRLSIKTFNAFLKDGTSDLGRNYISITPIEDFIFKLNLVCWGYMVFPTIASRKPYYMLDGLKRVELKYQKSGDEFIIPDEIIDIFFDYAQAEKNRIDKAEETIDNYSKLDDTGRRIKGSTDFEHLVEGYHYFTEGGKREKNISKGLARKFQHMFETFNGKDYDFVRDKSEIRDEIKKILQADIDKTIQFAIDNEIIDIDKGKLSSILLDDNMIDNLAKEYAGDKDAAIRSILADYTVNTKIASIETMMMFTGDVAFYTQDGTGNPAEDYAKRMAILTSSGSTPRETIPVEYEDPTYNVTTFSEQKLISRYLSTIRKVQKSLLLPKYNNDEALVNIILDRILKDYLSVSPTDAQVLVSPGFFKGEANRNGEWSDAKEEAFNLLNSTEDIPADKEQQLLNIVMQPIKDVYFDRVEYSINDEESVLIPTYDKMAIFTLFRRYVKGTHLEDLLDRMELTGKYAPGSELNKNNSLKKLCMAKFESAVKVGNRQRTDYFSNPDSASQKVNDLSEIPVYYQNFKFLRRQQATDPHELQRVLVASQFKKIPMANINDGDEYEHLLINGKPAKGIDIKRNINKSLITLSDKETHKFLDKLGVDEDGKMNDDLFYDTLLTDSKIAGMPENIQESLRTKVSIDLLPERKWILQRFAAMNNKYGIDLHMSGQQLIQMSGFGLGLKSVTDQTNNLRFLFDSKGNISGTECKISIQVFKDVIPDYERKSWEDKVKWLEDNPEILEGVGYRIPNQGQSSSIFLKIKEFLPESAGDVIILPNEFTALTGSDFDIDKVFFIRYNYKTDKDGKVSKVEFLTDENSNTDQRYNRILNEAFYDNKFIFDKESYSQLQEARDDFYGSIERRKALLGDNADKVSTLFTLRRELRRQFNEAITSTQRDFLYKQILGVESRIDDILYYSNIINESADTLSEYTKIIEDVLVSKNVLPSREQFKKLHEDGSIDYFQQNTKQAIQNYYLDNVKAIMLSRHHFLSTSAPLGAVTTRLKVLAGLVRKAEEMGSKRSFDFTGPVYQSELKFKLTSGNLGKAAFSLGNSLHVMTQIANVSFNKDIGVGIKDSEGRTSLHEKYGKVEKDGQRILISDYKSALVDSNVDIEKNPYIIDLNVVPPTYNVVQLLTGVGEGEKTFEFVSQPILKDLSREYINEVTEGNELGIRKNKPSVIVRTRWTKLYNDSLPSTGGAAEDARIKAKYRDYHPLDDNLLKVLQSPVRDSEWYYKQLQILELFNTLDKGAARDLNRLVMASRVDTKKWGTNLTEAKMYIDSVRSLYDDNLFTNLDKLLPFDPETETAPDIEDGTFNSAYLRNGPLLFTKLMSDRTISATKPFNDIIDRIIVLTKNKFARNKEGLMNHIADEVHSALLSRFFSDPKLLNLDNKKVGTIMGRVVHFLSNVNTDPKYKDKLKDNVLVQSLIKGRTVVDDLVFYGIPTIKSDDNFVKEDLTFAWQDLLQDDDETVRNFARQLFVYSFYTSGFKRGLYSIFHYIPPQMFKELEVNYTDEETGEKRQDILNFSDYVDGLLWTLQDPLMVDSIVSGIDLEVLKNNWYNPRYVQQIYSSDVGLEILTSKTKRPAIITITDRDTSNRMYLGGNFLKQPIYKPIITYRTTEEDSYVMEYIGYHKDTGNPIYKLVGKFGYYSKGRVIKEYGLEESMFKRNQVTLISDDKALSTMERDAMYSDISYVSPENRYLALNTKSAEEVEDMEELYRVTSTELIAGLVVKDGIVVEAAPILKWTIGQRFNDIRLTIEKGQLKDKGYEIERVDPTFTMESEKESIKNDINESGVYSEDQLKEINNIIDQTDVKSIEDVNDLINKICNQFGSPRVKLSIGGKNRFTIT